MCCVVVLVKPIITNCWINLYVEDGESERVEKTIPCFADDSNPKPQWISDREKLTFIEVKWDSDITLSASLPRVDYITNSPVPITITNTTFTVDFGTPSRSKVTNIWLI